MSEQAKALLPCPFCGDSENLQVIQVEGTILHPAYYVLCDNCGAQGSTRDRNGHAGAWNERAALSAPAQVGEAVAWQTRYRGPSGAWSDWNPAQDAEAMRRVVELLEAHGVTVEWRTLYTAPPAPSAADEEAAENFRKGWEAGRASNTTPTEDKGGAWPDDAAIRRVVMRYIDRMMDVCPPADPAERILKEFVADVWPIIDTALAAAAPQAPVGGDRPAWMAEVCNAAADAMEANGLANRTEQLRNVARQLAAAPPALTQPVELPERDPSRSNREQGLYRKFDVRRTDGSDKPGGKHHGCEYFVLDVTHDPGALPALTAYAASIEATHPDLALDMRERYALTQPAPSSGEGAK